MGVGQEDRGESSKSIGIEPLSIKKKISGSQHGRSPMSARKPVPRDSPLTRKPPPKLDPYDSPPPPRKESPVPVDNTSSDACARLQALAETTKSDVSLDRCG